MVMEKEKTSFDNLSMKQKIKLARIGKKIQKRMCNSCFAALQKKPFNAVEIIQQCEECSIKLDAQLTKMREIQKK